MGVRELMLRFAEQQKGPIAGYVLLLLVGTVVSLVGMTKVTAAMYKSVGANDRQESFKLLVALVILTVAFTVTNWSIDFLENRLMPTFRRYVRARVTHDIIDANETPLMTNVNALRFRAYISASTTATTTVFNAIIKQYIPNAIMAVVTLGFLCYLSPAYFGIFLGAIALIAMLFALNRKNMLGNAKKVELHVRHADMFAFDVLQNLTTVVGKGQVEKEKAAIEQKIALAARANVMQAQKFDNIVYILNGILATAVFATMALAINKLGDGATDKSIHAVLTALSLMAKLQNKMTALNNTNLSMVQNLGKYAANHMAEVDGFQAPENGVLPVCATGGWCDVELRFSDVTFTYPGASKPIIKNFSWAIGPRGVYCLRAPSGSGKSTLAKLVLRIFDVDSGAIKLNGMDVRKIDLNDLRKNVVLLNDSPFLDRTVREILCYGMGDTCASSARMEKVWKDNMEHMFEGLTLDDRVGPAGNRLSTGMGAMLRFNAALLTDTPLVIVDEPTNGLSPKYKAQVLQTLKELGLSKTVLLITHDDATCGISRDVMALESLA
jgi:ABC-type multidrug transport system fused ATPase/permease subunit